MMKKMDEQSSAAVLLEEILDQAYLDEGVTPEQLKQGKVIAQIEARLAAQGVATEPLYEEWQASSPAAIIAEYASLLDQNTEVESPDASSSAVVPLTGTLSVTFAGLKSHPLTGAFWIIEAAGLPTKVLSFRVLPRLRAECQRLKSEQPLLLSLELHRTDAGQEIFVRDIAYPAKSRVLSPTFPHAGFDRPAEHSQLPYSAQASAQGRECG